MSHRNDVDALLRRVPIFSSCSEDHLRSITSLSMPVTIVKGATVARQGELGHEFVVIVEGTASVWIDGDNVATLGPGSFFGELALLDNGPSPATVRAETDLLVEVIGQRDFSSMLNIAPEVAVRILRGVAEVLRGAYEHFSQGHHESSDAKSPTSDAHYSANEGGRHAALFGEPASD